MNLITTRNRQKATGLFLLFFFSLLYSCEKLEKLEEMIHKPPKYNPGKGRCSIDWYKLIAQIQLTANPAPSPLLNNRNFGYIGVGLYEAVQPGIKDAVSLSAKLYQMPEMPETEKHQEYLWGASANAALASMFKQFLTGLTEADIARIDC